FQLVAEPEGPGLGVDLVTAARFEGIVIPLAGLFQFAEDLLERTTADALFGLGGDGDLAGLLILVDIALVLEVFDKIPHAILIIRELLFLVQLIHPLERLAYVAVRIA